MLTLSDVQYAFADRHWHLNVQLEAHGVYALMGRSGSGKTTVLNLIGGFLVPSAGDICWKGESVLQLNAADRPVTTLFQQHNLFPHLTVWQNIGLGVAPNLRLDRSQRQRIRQILTDVGLDDYEQKRPASLSGGEQQRVALARCLLRQRPVLLLDEPFSALDETTRESMISLLARVIREYRPCLLMVTHKEKDATTLGAQILQMKNGTIASQ